jgi:hypothetical protein
MSNLAIHPCLGPTRVEFDNPTVATAVNPDPITGYTHGMVIPDVLLKYAKHLLRPNPRKQSRM